MKKIIAEAEFSDGQLNKISELSKITGLCEQTVRILYGRGIDTADKIDGFIHAGKERFLSPFLMSGIKEAVELITRARDEEWSVAIYGDYDADGVCASTVLCRALAEFGINAVVYVPERRNGYGLNEGSIDEIFEEFFPQLFITVDCGISNAREVEYIKEQGAEVIVTDHHELPEILPDCICVNPKIADDYPYDNLCGAGVAFKLACALNGRSAYKYLDFTAIATVADSVPLTGENRDIVAEGLKLINVSPRKNYVNFLKRDERVSSQSLAFSVAPKINAAGRMGDAQAAVSLFLSDDEKEIYDYTVKLTAYNLERQKYCDEMYSSAKRLLKQKGAFGRIIVLCGEDWNAGFVGIVAARLAEEYCRPALLFVKNGNKCKGSARSIDSVNIFEALRACSEHIEEFGGHSQAAGVNVDFDKLDALENALNEYLKANYTADAFTPSHCINGVFASSVPLEFMRELSLLEPFGVGNRKPQFVLDTAVCRTRPLKEGSPHLSIKGDGLDLIFFSGARYAKILRSGMPKRIVFEYSLSCFKGKEQVQGYVRDVVYMPEACAFAEKDINLNGVLSAVGEETDCERIAITAAQAQAELDGAGEYGTVFIAEALSTLRKYSLGDTEVNVFTLSAGNLSKVVLLSPLSDCDLSGYENVVFLDKPARITLPSLAGKKVRICTQIDGAAALSGLDGDREKLLSVFKALSANSFNVFGESAEEVAASNDFGVSGEQLLFALKVFEELGLVNFAGGKINVVRGIKTQLTNSRIYNFVNSLREG
ncbi:MAG: single-stranded-DNA-specific exonuclease RecJ [Clostridiales bacterium]|nr:single-stranded-DNA-specific exonuclease RecJ [Clostridiales bacterium]